MSSVSEARRSRGGKQKSFVAIDAGAIGFNMNDRLSVNSENQGLVSSFSGFLRLRGGLKLSRSLFFEPSGAASLPWRTGADGSTVKIFDFQTSLAFSYRPWSFLSFRFGPGLRMHWIHAEAETVTLNNGTGTSDFYIPNGDSMAFVWSLQAGFGIQWSKKWVTHFEVYALEVGDPNRLTFDATVTLGYLL